MGNMQSEPSAGGGSRKEQASDRAPDSRRTSLVEPEVTSQAMRLTRGLGVWFPGSSAPRGLLVPGESQTSPSTLPLTLERPSPVMPPPEEAAAVSAPSLAPAGTLLPGPSKWQKPAGTPAPRIRGLLEASHRGQGDPPSLRSLPPKPPPPPPRQLSVKDTVPRAPSQSPPSLEPWKPPPPLPSEWQPADRRITPALATPTSTPTESQAGAGSQGQTTGRARGGAPPQAGEGEMARPAASESSLSLLCKVTFKSGPSLAPPAASSSLAAKASLGGGGGGGLLAASGAISYAEVLKQGPLPPGAARPLGEVPRGAQEAEGGDGDGEGCSGPPSAPASQARALPPPPYTTFPGSKPKFDWVSAPDGPESHFRFNGAGGGIGAPRRRSVPLSGPWGSSPPPPGQMHSAPEPRRPAPALLAPPMFIFPAPTKGEPVRPGPPGLQELPPMPPPTPPPALPPTPPPASPPPTPQPPALQPTPLPVAPSPTPGPGYGESALAPTPGPGHAELALAPTPDPALPPALAADQTPAPDPAPSLAPAPTMAEPSLPALATAPKSRTRRNKGSRAARGTTREDGLSGDGPRERPTATVPDSSGGGGGGSGASQAGAANTGAARHWPPFQVLNSCPCKCYCRHQPRHRRLPRNVSAWLSTPTNHLSEPPWVATIKLAGSLVAGLEHYDLQTTHSN
ncbi:gametogenetin [Sapajus apella]|uniref:Gametogenetin n=1 Tax=Sapajus apella TaxID=9515 RepID=A0A6J3FHF4_SAPAP|nr:gametogenetin [Sapajus apella]